MNLNVEYVKGPVVIQACCWRKNGDHPDDRVGEREIGEVALLMAHPELVDEETGEIGPVPEDAPTYERLEGAVVRFFRHPDYPGDKICPRCERPWREHGWLEKDDAGVVHPGDWVITDSQGYRVMDPVLFVGCYRPVGPILTELARALRDAPGAVDPDDLARTVFDIVTKGGIRRGDAVTTDGPASAHRQLTTPPDQVLIDAQIGQQPNESEDSQG